ncbi:MAG: tetratricopeptide repeat protein [Saprospiraceae bacterium]|nr:tetratricopeptide repeat protein [Bacteroidia bacterium]MBT8228809.1 tetratricopeptide repeat protein [Bacteroidia bacterium]NNF22546.1 tetratricopeptide repeat protein [Saprospiraceae bacterium]
MEHRTKRDVTFLNLVSDFETNFEKGNDILLQEKTYLEIIRFYEEELQYDKAIEVADLALEKYSFRPDFYIIKARLLFQTNFHEEALVLLDKAENISPYEHDILLLKIRILAFRGEITEANEILDDMKRYVSSGDLSDVYLSESYINEIMQDYNGMYENLTKAIISDMDNEEAFERIGFAVQLSKKYKESIEFHNTIINEHPFNYLAWYNLGHALACEGEYQEAIDAIEYSFLTEENFENGYLDCSDICIQEKDFKRALAIYESYVDNFGINEEVLINMAECEYEIGHLNKARILLNKLLKLDPYNDEVYYKLGLCYAGAGNWAKAINSYHKAITLEDSCEDYYHAIAKAHHAVGSYEKSEFFFGKSVESGPEQSHFWKEYVSFLIKTGKKEKALSVLAESDDYTFGADLLFCKGIALYLSGYIKEANMAFEEGLKEDFEQHALIYEIEPELGLNKELQSMVDYYKDEVKEN